MTRYTLVRIAAIVAALSSCKPARERAREACSPSKLDACEAACNAGIAADGGCIEAGEGFEARSRAVDAGDDSARAQTAYARACEMGEAVGCRRFAALVGERFASTLPDGGTVTSLAIMSDAEASRREEALSRACAQSPDDCTKLGNALIGVDDARARSALDKGCAAVPDPSACRRSAIDAVDRAEGAGQSCRSGKPFGCARLADLVRKRDPARTTRFLREECKVRRLREDDCIGRRAAAQAMADDEVDFTASIGVIARARPIASPSPAELARRRERQRVRALVVDGISAAEAERVVGSITPRIRACYANGLERNPNLQGRVTAVFDLDGAGYPFLVQDGGSDLPDRAVSICVFHALEEEAFTATNLPVKFPILFLPE